MFYSPVREFNLIDFNDESHQSDGRKTANFRMTKYKNGSFSSDRFTQSYRTSQLKTF